MRRRSFLASLLALPAVAKAMVSRPPAPAPMPPAPAPPMAVATPYNDYWVSKGLVAVPFDDWWEAQLETAEPIRRGQAVYVDSKGRMTARAPYVGMKVGMALEDARDGRVRVRHTGQDFPGSRRWGQ